MLSGHALRAVLATPPTRPLRHVYWRASATHYVADPLGKKRPIGRNRFNVTGGARMLYCAEDQLTCLFEVQAFGFPGQAISLVPITLRLNSVLNLTDPRVLAILQTTTTEVGFNFRAMPPTAPSTPTQELGEMAAGMGTVDGIMWHSCAVPAGHPPKLDLAIVEAGVAALGSSVEAEDPLSKTLHSLP